ncbi:MAG: alpha/beta hydrolase [Bacillati bacterium ANGP1]|uniref:Alpha/beta hydrolase n=1 Tax=Candidatus Segetimicrobium genomatis TaxID=2569760 RepID=A0A537IKZ5_9BACT|nr:MAG: alpha/beta hydrolase [Terrabacteria group bacterium ANGP1]
MATFVLVPGFWLGGWCWQRVARQLRYGGHDVYPVTLTGLGERVHLATPQVDLETHITDVVNLIKFEDLRDVILVGHSGGGVVITGVADRIPNRLSQLVYLDSSPVPDGFAQIDTNTPKARAFVERVVAERGDGWRWPLPSWDELENVIGASLAGLGDKERTLMQARAVAQPFGIIRQPLRLKNPAREKLPRLGVLCSLSLSEVQEMIASGPPWARELSGPQWRFFELPTGHWPMFSRPDDVARLLDKLTAG